MLKYIWSIIVKIILWLLSLIYSFVILVAQDAPPQDEMMLLGSFTWEEWSQNIKWKDTTGGNYQPKLEVTKKINQAMKGKNIDFQLFVASWCKDSETEMPKIVRVYRLLEMDLEGMAIWGLNKEKRDPTGTSEKYKILKVPTLVVQSNKIEIGRIIEFPKKSWEEDILDIINQAK